VTFGPKEAEQMLRAMLGTGADRAIRIDATDDVLDGDVVARGLKAVVDKEKAFKDMTDDEALEAALADKDNCHFPGCKYITTYNSHLCALCKFKYCVKHRLPETHGCAEAARKRAQAQKNTSSNSSGQPKKKLTAANRAYLERKLHQKIEQSETDRSKKKTDEKK